MVRGWHPQPPAQLRSRLVKKEVRACIKKSKIVFIFIHKCSFQRLLTLRLLASVKTHLHLFPANLGGSACCSEICSAGNFGGSAFRRPFGHDSACGLSKLVALLPNFMQIVHIWSEEGVMLCDLT